MIIDDESLCENIAIDGDREGIRYDQGVIVGVKFILLLLLLLDFIDASERNISVGRIYIFSIVCYLTKTSQMHTFILSDMLNPVGYQQFCGGQAFY